MDYTFKDCQIGNQSCSDYKPSNVGNQCLLLRSLTTDYGYLFKTQTIIKEHDLIIMRSDTELDMNKPICGKHRFTLGKDFRPPKSCKSPIHPGSSKQKGDNTSYDIYSKIKSLYPEWKFVLGYKVCRIKLGTLEDNQLDCVEVKSDEDPDYVPDVPMIDDALLEENQRKLNILTELFKTEPLKYTIHKPVQDLSETAVAYFRNAHAEMQSRLTDLFCNIAAPGQSKCLMEKITVKRDEQTGGDNSVKHLINAFSLCKTRAARVSVLTLLPTSYTKTQTVLLFGCSQKEIDDARNIAKISSPCAPKSEKVRVYSRLSMSKAEHFIDFLFDTAILQETAYGTTKIKFNTGDAV